MHKNVRFVNFALLAVLVLCAAAMAADKPNITGWEKGGAYDKHYDPKEADSFKGRVEEIIDIAPMPGMAPGIGLLVRDKKDNKAEIVHLGPKDAVDMTVIGLKKGDSVKVMGVWATVGGKEVVLASKVKKDEGVELKLRRTRDGMPFWGLTPEEQAAEKKGE